MVVKMTRRGTVTLPRDLRQGLGEEAGFEAVRREDGVIELRPRAQMHPDQAWFWTDRWQKMEREADQSYARGDFRRFETGEEFLTYLEDLDSKIDSGG